MSDCSTCKYAEFDYEEFSGWGKQWFISGCKKDNDPADCVEYEEYIDERVY